MAGIYILVFVMFVVLLIAIFIFVWQARVGTSETAKELGGKLQTAQRPSFSPLSIINNFIKFLSSLFH
jgi:hypothetical protein